MDHHTIEGSAGSPKFKMRADSISYWIILITIVLIPLFFIPSSLFPFQFSKVVLVYLSVIASSIVWIISRLKEGKIHIPFHLLTIGLGSIPVVHVIAALFSPTKSLSFLGQGFEVGTAAFVLSLSAIAFLTDLLFRTKKSVAYAYAAFLIATVLVGLIHLVRIFVGPGFLSFGVLTTANASIVGSWNDLGIFVGAAALFSFISLELLTLPRWLRVSFISILVGALFLLSVVSFSMVWYVLGSIALIFFIYNFSFRKVHTDHAHSQRSLPLISLIIMVVSFIFVISNGNIYSKLADEPFTIRALAPLGIPNTEVRPSLQATLSLAKDALMQKPILGVGPNRFVDVWAESRPQAINATNLWSVDFNYGFGLIPTFLITTGVLGFAAWVFFFAVFVYMGFKALFRKATDPFDHYIQISSFIIAAYLWIFAWVYVPSAVILVLMFFFTGIFMASLATSGMIKTRSFEFTSDPRISFGSILVFVVLLLGLVMATYTVNKRLIAAVYYNKALVAANTQGDVAAADLYLNRAVRFARLDVYYRALSELNLIKINRLLSQNNLSQDVLQSQFRTFYGDALKAAQNAVAVNPEHYENVLSLGRVYETVVPLNTDKAYESAVSAYTRARELNPSNPAISLVLARLDVAHNDIAKAKDHINTALQLKPDYTDAIFFLSQIQVNEGEIKDAIQSVEAAAVLNPNDPGVYFQLGLLRYNDKNYTGAASALEQAVILSPEYANARYFLGLSYAQLQRRDEAVAQFEEVAKTNPDNAEVALILSNIKAGRDPFANATPPIDNAPEKRSRPPVKDTTSSNTETSER